jgi:hypothetical protein
LEIVSGDTVYGDTDGTEESALWYSFIGTGGVVTASTCYSGTDGSFDSYLEIYSGDCNGLSLEFYNDDDHSCPTSSLHSTLSGFETSVGVEYHLKVRGFAGDTGAFELVFEMTSGSPKGSGGKKGGKQKGGGKQKEGGKKRGLRVVMAEKNLY